MAKRKKYELKKSAKAMLCLIFAGLSAGMLYSSAQELQTMLQLKESKKKQELFFQLPFLWKGTL